MKKRLAFILLSFVFMSNTCKNENENCQSTIAFINNSEDSLYVTALISYPDTLQLKYSANPQGNSYMKTLPKEKNTMALRGNDCIEKEFIYEIPDTLMVFIINSKVVENNTWQKIGDNYMVLQRYDLSLQDLQQLNWQISYPPTEAMKDMKMYPPYGSE